MDQITVDDIDNISLGATLLGAGGGGDIFIARLIARQALERHGPVRLVSAAEFDPEAWMLPVGYVGATTVLLEKIPNGSEAAAAIAALQRYMGIEAAAIMPVEVGGANTLIPIAVAAERGLPLVDADTMRRAFPEIQMTLLSAAGISATPMALADAKGNGLVCETTDNRSTEAIVRSAVVAMGYQAAAASYVVRAQQVVDHAVLGSVSYCAQIGERIAEVQRGREGAWDELLRFAEGTVLFRGKVVDVNRVTTNGFARAVIALEELSDPDRVLRVDAQNENLVAVEDGRVLAVTPDLICFVDSETAMPISVESVRYGMRLHVLALPCAERWKTEAGFALVGPRAFGYDIDYVEFTR